MVEFRPLSVVARSEDANFYPASIEGGTLALSDDTLPSSYVLFPGPDVTLRQAAADASFSAIGATSPVTLSFLIERITTISTLAFEVSGGGASFRLSDAWSDASSTPPIQVPLWVDVVLTDGATVSGGDVVDLAAMASGFSVAIENTTPRGEGDSNRSADFYIYELRVTTDAVVLSAVWYEPPLRQYPRQDDRASMGVRRMWPRTESRRIGHIP